ncbi:MAG: TetR/AcrR family transcriptional regulator [Leptospiraceae bacterium]|nr:TetR/AcrR family transcriptional regulator [Leptospiraceae bacterium]
MSEKLQKLKKEKQTAIINAAVLEFSKAGFQNASTNAIVKHAEISKGSLFQYFSDKRELYFFILDYSLDRNYEYVAAHFEKFKTHDFLSRIELYIDLQIEFAIKFPHEFQIFLHSLVDDTHSFNGDLIKHVQKRAEQRNLAEVLIGKDDTKMLFEKERIFQLLQYFFNGLKFEVMISNAPDSADFLKKLKIASKDFFELLRKGIYLK